MDLFRTADTRASIRRSVVLFQAIDRYRPPPSIARFLVVNVVAFYTGVVMAAITEQNYKVRIPSSVSIDWPVIAYQGPSNHSKCNCNCSCQCIAAISTVVLKIHSICQSLRTVVYSFKLPRPIIQEVL